MFSSKSKSQKLTEKSRGIIDVFTSTKNKLLEVNAEMRDATAENLTEIPRLEQENSELNEAHSTNSRVIENIDKIFQ